MKLFSQLLNFIFIMNSMSASVGYASSSVSADQVFQDYYDLRKGFKLGSSDEDFGEENIDSSTVFFGRYRQDQGDNVEATAKLLNSSYRYLDENKDNPKVNKTREFKRVFAIAKKAKNFRILNEKLGDDGCLTNASSRVRSIAKATLAGALASELDPCQRSSEDEEIDNLFADVNKVSNCLKTESCSTYFNLSKGIQGAPVPYKLNFVKEFFKLKKRNSEISKGFIDVAFGGECKLGDYTCRQINEILPKENSLPKSKQEALNRINNSLKNVDDLHQNDLQNNKYFVVKRRLENRLGLGKKKTVRFSLDGSEEAQAELDRIIPERPAASELTKPFTVHRVELPEVKNEIADLILKTPLSFATRGALEECAPHITQLMNLKPTIKYDSGTYEISYSAIDGIQLSKEDLNCLAENTKSDFTKRYDQTIKDFEERLLDESDNNKDEDEKVNNIFEGMIIDDPISLGEGPATAYLIAKYGKAVKEVAKEIEVIVTRFQIDETDSFTVSIKFNSLLEETTFNQISKNIDVYIEDSK